VTAPNKIIKRASFKGKIPIINIGETFFKGR